MKTKLLWITLALASLNATLAAAELIPLPQQPQAAFLSAQVLNRYHYKRIPLDEATSTKVFDNYLKGLDSEKFFFLQADINRFEAERPRLIDAVLKENLSTPFAIYNLYQQRVAERIRYARSLLSQGFDFESPDSYQYLRKHAAWPKSEEEINELWRRRVKNDWLRLKLTGKDDKSISNTLNKRYDNTLSSLAKVKSDDVFQRFMSAYAMTIDPHTDYFGTRASEDFDISMRLSLVGIGAVLQDKDDFTTIRELVAGGPAALSGRLKVGDRIVGVGQGSSPITEVQGQRLDDTVALIRGAEDTTVRLDILPAEATPDGKHKLITLIRKKITLDKQAAKKSILDITDGETTRHIGIITLPGFYLDFAARQRGDKNFRSASRDVSQLLKEFKKDKVDSVLIDLRNNGGGSLDEAIELTGLFIDKGPVVQQRDSKGKISVSSDLNAGMAWQGPLGILINRGSASASEIFAAAIQDYGRGIVIGETSFGKGTVQSVIDLDGLVKNPQPKFGELKMTIAQFFRVNGGTTQLRGVVPDITLPGMIDEEEFGESSYDNALPWSQIKAADYTRAGNLAPVVPLLIDKHKQRIATDQDFKYLEEDIKEFNTRRRENKISLNETERRHEREVQEARIKLREKNRGDKAEPTGTGFQDDGLQANERNLEADIALENTRKNAKDVLLNEAAHILSDEVALLKAKSRLAASTLPEVQ
ncbi:MAG: carboxy terminal-processing peptidase [Gallionella sp.]|nr:carboxy terminal-processing peptidase [Gallionella sp.]